MHEMALLCTSWPQKRGGNWFVAATSQMNWLYRIIYIVHVCVCMCVESFCPMWGPLASVCPWLHHMQSVCRPVYHIGDEGNHLEELEEGTSHHEREGQYPSPLWVTRLRRSVWTV